MALALFVKESAAPALQSRDPQRAGVWMGSRRDLSIAAVTAAWVRRVPPDTVPLTTNFSLTHGPAGQCGSSPGMRRRSIPSRFPYPLLSLGPRSVLEETETATTRLVCGPNAKDRSNGLRPDHQMEWECRYPYLFT